MAEKRWAMCPSCKKAGEFEFLGEQRWPADVAMRLGLPAIITLWSCEHCHTTISETDLMVPRISGANAPKAQSQK